MITLKVESDDSQQINTRVSNVLENKVMGRNNISKLSNTEVK
jgi:hypothetical protein